MKRVFWTEQAEPIETSFARVLYDIRREDPDDLLMDSVTAYDIACDYDGLMALDALVVPFKTLERQMNVMRRVMNRVGTEIRVKEDDGEEKGIEISDVFKRNGTANIAVTFMLTDGQTISVIFHNPDMTPNKIDPTDELISWKWMINKKDVSIVVAPEQGKDLKVQEVARRIMKLANKNSAAFQRANAKRAERMKNIENQKTEIAQLEAELAKAQRDLETAKIEYEDADYRRVNARKTMTANTSSRDSLQTEKAAKEKAMADEAAKKAQEEARLAEERAAKEAAQAKPAMDPEDIIDRLPPAVKKLVKGNTIMEMGSDRMLIDHAAMMASAGIIEWEDDDAFTIKTIYKDGIPMTEQEKDVWIGQFRESYLDLKDGTLHYKDGREFKPDDVTSVLDKKASENQLLKEMNIIPDPDNEEILEGTMTRYDSERGDPRAVQMIKEILKTKGAKPKWAVVKATDDFNEYSTWSVTTPIIDFKEDPIEIGVHFEGGSWEYSVTVGKSPNGNASIHWYSNNYDPMVRKKGSWSGSVPTELFDKLAAIIGLKRVSETSISVQKKPVEQVAQPTPDPAEKETPAPVKQPTPAPAEQPAAKPVQVKPIQKDVQEILDKAFEDAGPAYDFYLMKSRNISSEDDLEYFFRNLGYPIKYSEDKGGWWPENDKSPIDKRGNVMDSVAFRKFVNSFINVRYQKDTGKFINAFNEEVYPTRIGDVFNGGPSLREGRKRIVNGHYDYVNTYQNKYNTGDSRAFDGIAKIREFKVLSSQAQRDLANPFEAQFALKSNENPSNGYCVVLACKVDPTGNDRKEYTLIVEDQNKYGSEPQYAIKVFNCGINNALHGIEKFREFEISEDQYMSILSAMKITMRNKNVYEMDEEDPNEASIYDRLIKNGIRVLKRNGSFAFPSFKERSVEEAVSDAGFDAIVSDLKSRGISESLIKDNVVEGNIESLSRFVQTFIGSASEDYAKFVKKNAEENNAPATEQPAEPAPEQPKQTVSGLKPMNLYDPEADENAEAGITSEVAPEEVVSADNGEWLKDQQILQSIINGTHPNVLDDSIADFFEQMFQKYSEDEEKATVINEAMEAWTQAMLSATNGLK